MGGKPVTGLTGRQSSTAGTEVWDARPPSPLSMVVKAQIALSLLGGKWVVPILDVLSTRPRRHGELRRALGPRLHEKVLTETLRRMEKAGLINREVVSGLPPSVLYALTDLGHSLLEPVEHLAEWTDAHRRDIEDAGRTGGAALHAAGSE